MSNSFPGFLAAAGHGGASNAALVSFGVYLGLVLLLAVFASRTLKKRSFVSEYFLGSRSLGTWALALTFAATSASGGSFMGFPSLIYTHGWVLALWIASYMVLPIVAMGFLGKRLNQVARKTGAITVPEVLRERFGSLSVGMVATLLIVFFMFFYLLAQFKAGSNILTTLLKDIQLYSDCVAWVGTTIEPIPWLNRAEPDYLLCLIAFAVAVIAYTTYGGFRAVVWTDVLQGFIMGGGVLVMLFLTLMLVGGLGNATRKLAEMTPPDPGRAVLQIAEPASDVVSIPKGAWIRAEPEPNSDPNPDPDLAGTDRPATLVRTAERTTIAAGASSSPPVSIIRITDTVGAQPPEDRIEKGLTARITEIEPYRFGAGQAGVYVSAPGPDPNKDIGFLSIGLAMSFFVFWAFGATGQPSNMVRLMAFRDTMTLRRAIATVSIYYSLIYFPLVIIFCCARLVLPGMEVDSDRVMPEMATHVTAAAGMPWLAGLLVAAPFAAVMSSVDSFLLMVSSSLVRDVYQRNINPNASERRLKGLTYAVTALVGIAAVLAVINPPRYLQNLIIFATSGLAGCFLVPMTLALYWRRINGPGTIAGMLGGCGTHLLLYIVGYLTEGRFTVYQFLGIQPFIWDLIGSAVCAVAFTLLTRSPAAAQQARFFDESGSPNRPG